MNDLWQRRSNIRCCPMLQSRRRRRVVACAVAIAATLISGGGPRFSSTHAAEETPAAGSPAAGSPSVTETPATPEIREQIGQWIADWDAPQFGKRQAATQRLLKAGQAAFPQLLEAARHPSREVSERALDVLEQHHRLGDAAIKEAAGEALRKLAGPEDAAALDRVARAARAALRPANDANNPGLARVNAAALIQARLNAGRARAIAGNIGVANGGIRVNGGIARSISVSDINGSKKIQIREKERSVSIDLPRGGPIALELTETKDGKSTTRKFEAKDLDELKQKHPEAHKVYEEFAPMFGGVRTPPAAPPAPIPAATPPAPATPPTPAKR